MTSKVPSEPLAAQVAHLSADVDCLDEGLVAVGVTASEALALARALETGLEVALRAAALDDEPGAGTASYTDPVAARVQARKRRIEKSGFRLIAGGAS
jgi:hypothetical protein